jgi:broad specificity phosphatase PhoE
MGRFVTIVIAVCLAASQHTAIAFAQEGSPSLIVLVRHGDTSPDVPGDRPLNALGVRRANDLAAALGHVGLTAIITTQVRRTRETAQPVASKFKLATEIVPYRGNDLSGHIQATVAAVRRHPGGAVLVVAHTNTLPPLISTLGGPQVATICETTFDNLFMLVPGAAGVRFVHGRYGAANSPTEPNCH